MTRFDRDTAVAPAGDGVFDARIDRGWWIVRGPNGGYVAALLLRALTEATGDPSRTPRSLTVHYTVPPEEGPVRIETRRERNGRSLTTLSARMFQGERLLALGLGAFSEPRPGIVFQEAVMPEVAPPEHATSQGLGDKRLPIHERYEYRWALGAPPFSGGNEALCGGWIRLAERRPLDALALAAFVDAWPPAVFSRTRLGEIAAGVPTVDLTVHFRAQLPPSGADSHEFVLARFRSRRAAEGFVEEDGEIWSRDGELLAQSRQLAALL